jgi:hypothetical protein
MVSTSGPGEPPPTEVIEALVPSVVTGVAEVVALIPDRPAAVLGRLSVPVDPAEERARILSPHMPTEYPIRRDWPHEDQSKVASAFDRLPETLVERILGALELRITGLVLEPAPPAPALGRLAGPPPPGGEFVMLSVREQTEAKTALGWVEVLRPGATPLVEALARALADRREVAAQLEVGPDVTEEEAILAAHGAAHLALATVVATAVLRATDPDGRPDPAGVVGVALGVAVRLLDDAPLPAHFTDAQLARRRAEYRFGYAASRWSVAARNHQVALVEGAPPGTVDFSANGLVAAVSDGVVVRTGTADGHVGLEFHVTEDAPPEVETDGWDEVVEVSWTAPSGWARFVGCDLETGTPPWPGDYRVRVHARGRDDVEGREDLRFDVWPAPAAPPMVHKHFDLLGHRLRGEPEPRRPEPPPEPDLPDYKWLSGPTRPEAMCITVATRLSPEEVLLAFGADPHGPTVALADLDYGENDPMVAVIPVEGAVVAIEDNGWEGSRPEVLRPLSAGGRAGSMFWNVNSSMRVSVAEAGRLIGSFDPVDPDQRWGDEPAAVDPLIADLDFDAGDWIPLGMAVVERFTGVHVTRDILSGIDRVHVIEPVLDDQPVYELWWHSPLHRSDPPLAAAINNLPREDLRRLAQRAALEAVAATDLAGHLEVQAAVALFGEPPGRPTPEFEKFVRSVNAATSKRIDEEWIYMGPGTAVARVDGPNTREGWKRRAAVKALRAALNSDPLSAALDAVDAARFAFPDHQDEFIDRIRPQP